MPLTRPLLFTLMLAVAGSTAASDGDDWTQFRGHRGTGWSGAVGLPVSWSSSENIAWKAALPGPGTSSPIVLGDRVFVTAYSGYGLVPGEGDMSNLRRHVLCLDLGTGKILWNRKFMPELPESKYSPGNSSWHGYASSTPATDGERLYVFFGKSGVSCLDLDGKEIWNTKVGSRATGWGSSNSPVLYKNLVVLNASVESRALVALDKGTGKEVWRAENIRSSWNTPILVDMPGGDAELVLSDSEKVAGFDPATGKELWRVTGFKGYVCPSVTAHKGVVYAVRGESLAIRAGGRGDVTETHVLWRERRGSKVPSPVYHDGHLYWVARGGSAICVNASTGATVYRQRLTPRPGVIYASSIVADGKVYCVTQKDGVFVLAASPTFKQLAHNVFENDRSRTNASPVVAGKRLLMRTDRMLYCIGK